MDERDWQIISLLYKNKNITKTANNRYISQPALTGRIKQIEQDLGVSILTRSNRGVEFTPHGVFVAEFASLSCASWLRRGGGVPSLRL